MKEKGLKGILSAAIFVFLEVAALGMLSRSESLQNLWVKRFPRMIQASLWRGGENMRNFVSLKSQNEALAQENFALSEELRKYREALSGRESDVDPAERSSSFSYLPARIVKMSRNSQHNYIVLDKGAADGVKPLSGIITGTGIVGIVDAVDEHYSYGMTLMNTSATFSVRMGRNGVVAPLVWDGLHSDRALMRDLPLHYPVNHGDTVWTSGFSSIFPADVPVGTVVRTKMKNGSTNEVTVALFQDISTLRSVTLVWNPDQDSVDRLSEGEAQ